MLEESGGAGCEETQKLGQRVRGSLIGYNPHLGLKLAIPFEFDDISRTNPASSVWKVNQ
jgi:hypothetical protein